MYGRVSVVAIVVGESFMYGLKSIFSFPNSSKIYITYSSIGLSIPRYGVRKYYHGTMNFFGIGGNLELSS